MTYARLISCLFAIFLSSVVHAENTLELVAPESVQGLLRAYLTLPESEIKDEAERQTTLRRLEREASDLLATEGYFSPRIDLQHQQDRDLLIIDPREKAQVALLNLIFKGDIAADEAEKKQRVQALRNNWRLPVGGVFRSEDWENAKAELVSEVASQEYMLANIAYSQADVDPVANTVSLTLVIDSGPGLVFDEVIIEGLKRYDPLLVNRFLTFKKGEIYQRDKLLSFQTRLQSMPQFTSVRVSGEPDLSNYVEGREFESVPEPIALPIVVKLSEIKPKKVSVGLGYSSNHGPRAELSYLDHRFLGQLWSLQSSVRLEKSRQTWTANVDSLPDERKYVYSVGATGEATQIEDLETRRQKVSVSRSRSKNNIERRSGLSWQQELQRHATGEEDITQALVLDWLWHKRAVDNPLNPRDGYSTQIRIGGAYKTLMSDQSFIRNYVHHQWWFPINKQNILSARGELGWTLAPSRNGIPQEYLFRTGGTQTIRGYDYQSLGVADEGSIVGGRVMVAWGLEHTYWFKPNWGGAVFVDGGDSADQWRALSPVLGYGFGVRWLSPVGPLALDLATGNQSDKWKPHFSISVAF